MRIVIDLQGAQTSSRLRGIGRYSLEFARAVAKESDSHEVLLVLSSLFPETIAPLRRAFKGIVPDQKILVWAAPPFDIHDLAERHAETEACRDLVELIREDFIASLKPDVVHLSSLFEGFVDSGITSIGRLDGSPVVTAVLFDLIPFHTMDQISEGEPRFRAFYNRKLESVSHSNGLLAISDYVARDFQDSLPDLSIPVANISAACSEAFRPASKNPEAEEGLFQKFAIDGPFILSVGAGDERKNFRLILESFASLDEHIVSTHQVVIVGSFKDNPGEQMALCELASQLGLASDKLLFTGRVSDDELIMLYSTCAVFVFASAEEGFGLPALEAMRCGAPVIAADASSLPEAVGPEGLLFKPGSSADLGAKLGEVLKNASLRASLTEAGLRHSAAFTWDRTASLAIDFWEKLVLQKNDPATSEVRPAQRTQFISKLIENKKVEALSEQSLAEILALNERIADNAQLFIDISELHHRDSGTGIQRVVKQHLQHLMNECPPGFRPVPVYFEPGSGYCRAPIPQSLADTVNCSPSDIDQPIDWERGDIFLCLDLHHSAQVSNAGFYSRLRAEGVAVVFLVYDLLPIKDADMFPNRELKKLHEDLLKVVVDSDGAICISNSVASDLRDWIAANDLSPSPYFKIQSYALGSDFASSSTQSSDSGLDTPLITALRERPTFLCVSTIEPRKRQAQILEAAELLWKGGQQINLVMVGRAGWNVDELVSKIRQHAELEHRLFWLQGIADSQLAALYDEATCVICASTDEGFGLSLVEAAFHETPLLVRDIPVFREVAGEGATYFRGETAQELADAMRGWLSDHTHGTYSQPLAVKVLSWQASTDELVRRLHLSAPRRQLLVDVTETMSRPFTTGIERSAKSLLTEWLRQPPPGFRVEPVYSSTDPTQPFRYARRFKSELTGMESHELEDSPIEFGPGDIYCCVELSHHGARLQRENLSRMQMHGVFTVQLIFDLLPIQFPDFFPKIYELPKVHKEWLDVVRTFNANICISRETALILSSWMEDNPREDGYLPVIDWSHCGCLPVASDGLNNRRYSDFEVRKPDSHSVSFLMVGTLEPRKGYEETLKGFERLWQTNSKVSLTIVGKEGWNCKKVITAIKKMQGEGAPIAWLSNVDDATLSEVYSRSSCLLAASYAEGFGLPIIEAAQHGLPILARDIPIFREVAGEGNAFFFSASSPQDLADAIDEWLELFAEDQHPKSDRLSYLTWQDSAASLFDAIRRAMK